MFRSALTCINPLVPTAMPVALARKLSTSLYVYVNILRSVGQEFTCLQAPPVIEALKRFLFYGVFLAPFWISADSRYQIETVKEPLHIK